MASASAALRARFTFWDRKMQISQQNVKRTLIEAGFAVYTTDQTVSF